MITIESIVSALMELLIESVAVMKSSAVEVSAFCSLTKHISKQISEDIIFIGSGKMVLPITILAVSTAEVSISILFLCSRSIRIESRLESDMSEFIV